MVNKPKNDGTAVETMFASYLVETGFPYAERRSLQGALDKGDITGCPGLVWECKLARRGFLLGPWLRETELERVNARADYGILVCKPHGLGARSVGGWPAFMTFGQFCHLQMRAYSVARSDEPFQFAKLEVKNTLQIMPTLRGVIKPRVLYCPPGKKDEPTKWYCATDVRSMVELVRQAGYGTSLDPE